MAAFNESTVSGSKFKLISAQELMEKAEVQEHNVRSWIKDLRQLFDAGVDLSGRGIEDSALGFVRRKFEHASLEEQVMALALVEHWMAEPAKAR